MSNEYSVADGVIVYEQSMRLSIEANNGLGNYTITKDMTVAEYRTMIIKMIEVLSYFDDGVLERFNVEYGELK
jgi:hypothetical protein